MGKPWYKSRGVMGAATVILATVLGFIGIDVGDQATFSKEIIELVTGLAALVGGVLALIGRLKAKDKIKGFEDPGGDDVSGG